MDTGMRIEICVCLWHIPLWWTNHLYSLGWSLVLKLLGLLWLPMWWLNLKSWPQQEGKQRTKRKKKQTNLRYSFWGWAFTCFEKEEATWFLLLSSNSYGRALCVRIISWKIKLQFELQDLTNDNLWFFVVL